MVDILYFRQRQVDVRTTYMRREAHVGVSFLRGIHSMVVFLLVSLKNQPKTCKRVPKNDRPACIQHI